MKGISTYFSTRRRECVSPFFDMNSENNDDPTATMEHRFSSAVTLSDISEDSPTYESVSKPCTVHGTKYLAQNSNRQLPGAWTQRSSSNFELKTDDERSNVRSSAILNASRNAIQNSEASMKMQYSMDDLENIPCNSRFNMTAPSNNRLEDSDRKKTDHASAVENHLKEHFDSRKIARPTYRITRKEEKIKALKTPKTNFHERRQKFEEAVIEYQLEIYKNRYFNSRQNIFEEDCINQQSSIRDAYCDLKLENIKIKTEKEWLRLEIDRMHDCFRNLCGKVEKLNNETKMVVTNITIRMDRAFEYVYRLKATLDQKRKWFSFKWR